MKQTVSGGASASSQSARPGRFARLRRAVATFMGLALSGATAVAAQPAAVPQHWVSYAQLLGNQFQAWLGDDANPAVVRVHELMGGPKDAGDAVAAAAQPVVAKVWVDATGRVERVEFPTLIDTRVRDALTEVLANRSLAEAPPADMRQPLVLQLKLEPAAGGVPPACPLRANLDCGTGRGRYTGGPLSVTRNLHDRHRAPATAGTTPCSAAIAFSTPLNTRRPWWPGAWLTSPARSDCGPTARCRTRCASRSNGPSSAPRPSCGAWAWISPTWSRWCPSRGCRRPLSDFREVKSRYMRAFPAWTILGVAELARPALAVEIRLVAATRA